MDSRKPSHQTNEPIELRPDGEERFLSAVRAAAKHGAMHRDKSAPPSVQNTGKRKLRRFSELAK